MATRKTCSGIQARLDPEGRKDVTQLGTSLGWSKSSLAEYHPPHDPPRHYYSSDTTNESSGTALVEVLQATVSIVPYSSSEHTFGGRLSSGHYSIASSRNRTTSLTRSLTMPYAIPSFLFDDLSMVRITANMVL